MKQGTNSYDVGDVVVLRCEFSDPLTRERVDPATVEVYIKDPLGDVAVGSATSEEAGVWTFQVEPLLPGEWAYRFQGTGVAKAAAEGRFWVEQSLFPI